MCMAVVAIRPQEGEDWLSANATGSTDSTKATSRHPRASRGSAPSKVCDENDGSVLQPDAACLFRKYRLRRIRRPKYVESQRPRRVEKIAIGDGRQNAGVPKRANRIMLRLSLNFRPSRITGYSRSAIKIITNSRHFEKV